jgi:hypothetical protein
VVDDGGGRSSAVAALRRPVVATARRLRPAAGTTAPADRSVLDDIAMRRPWNVVVKAARRRARRRLPHLVQGTTVVIVNWNTAAVLRDVLRAVWELSPPDTQVLVCDNGSTDASRDVLRADRRIQTLLLPRNAGHGAALDLSLCRVRTRVAVTLDSDAIPLRRGWLDPVVEPVRSGRAVLAGTRSSRDFVHPVLAAVDVRAFVLRGLSFQVHFLPGVTGADARWGVDAWDTGELMSLAVPTSEIVFVEGRSLGTDALPGGLVGDLVYHHGGMTRVAGGRLSDEAIAGWRTACTALGLDFLRHDDG